MERKSRVGERIFFPPHSPQEDVARRVAARVGDEAGDAGLREPLRECPHRRRAVRPLIDMGQGVRMESLHVRLERGDRRRILGGGLFDRERYRDLPRVIAPPRAVYRVVR